MMELSNALEGDLRGAMEVCEKEATKPTAVTVADMRLAVDAGVLSGPYAVTTSATGAAAGAGAGAGGSNDVAVGKVGSGKNSSKVVVSPGKDVAAHTEKNTVLNSVSKLPLLIKKTSEHSHQSSNHSSEHSTSTTGSAGEGEHSAAGEHPVAGNIYAQLPQYDGQAMAYVRSFNAPKRTKTWKWCKSSAQDVNAMVQGMFPVVRGPVDLVVTQPDNPRASAQSNNNNGTSGNTKTPAVPSFRRRVGHSSKNPFAGPLNSNPNYFSRERASVGSPGMPVGWLKSGGGGGSEEGDRDGGDGDNVGERVGSPTETAEDARKRALKFMLSDRETHYDLMHREVVDAVTMQQMDQARMAAAARRRAEAEAAQMSPAALAEAELHTHQYRAHQLLKDDYSSKRTGGRSGRSGRIGGAGLEGDEDDEEEESEEYSLYVSLPEMSAHSALTARQAIRTMQNASAGITFETISKVY